MHLVWIGSVCRISTPYVPEECEDAYAEGDKEPCCLCAHDNCTAKLVRCTCDEGVKE